MAAAQQSQQTELERFLIIVIKLGIFLVLIMPLIVTTDTLFPFIVGKALFARGTIEIVFGLWLIVAFKYPQHRPPRSWALVAFGVYLGVALLAGIVGVSLQRSLWSTYERMQGIVDLTHWFAYAVVVASVFRSMLDWRILLNINLGVSLVMALMGIAQHYDADVFSFYPFLKSTRRLDVTLGNATFVGAYMMANIFIAFAFLAHSFYARRELATSQVAETRATQRRRRRRSRGRASTTGSDATVYWWWIFWVATIALDFWIMVLSGTRGALGGLVISLIAIAILYVAWGRIRYLRFASIAVVSVLVLLIALFFVIRDTEFYDSLADKNILLKRISTLGLDDKNVRGRLDSWEAGLEGFAARPLLGWGPENYVVAWGRYFDTPTEQTRTFDQAHNKPVEELTTKGVLGLVSYIALWATITWAMLRKLRRDETAAQLFTLFITAAVVGYFVQNLFLFDTPATFLQFMVLFGYAVYIETTLTSREEQPAEESGGLIARASQWSGRLPSWSQRALPYLGVIAVIAAVSISLFYVIYRPYQAATAVVSTNRSSLTWDERLDLFDESIDQFKPLANYPRLILFTQLVSNWNDLSDEEKVTSLAIVEQEARDALEAEPEGWRIHTSLARVYQVASTLDASYLDRARIVLDLAAQLAPGMPEVAALQAQQERFEQSISR